MIRRLRNFIDRSRQLAAVIDPPAMAPLYFAARRFIPHYLFSGRYNGVPFTFRTMDYSAVREVLFEEEYKFLLPHIKGRTSPNVLDVGGHIGLFASWLLKNAPDALVLSVEASPETFRIIERNAAAAQRNWKVRHGAAWDSHESLSFMDRGDAMSHKVAAGGSAQVQGVTLADLLEGVDMVDLLKVDIEGAEERFICAQPELLCKVQALVIELHPKYCNTDRVMEVLRGEFPRIEQMNGRESSNPLLLCLR